MPFPVEMFLKMEISRNLVAPVIPPPRGSMAGCIANEVSQLLAGGDEQRHQTHSLRNVGVPRCYVPGLGISNRPVK